MSNWFVMLAGIIVGVLIGILFGKKSYDGCREKVEKLEGDIENSKDELARTESEIGDAENRLKEVTAEVSEAEKAAQELAASRSESIDLESDVAAEAVSDDESAVAEHVTECPQKLARIKGIGRVYEDKLYKAGVGTFWQVATLAADDLAAIFGLKDFQAVDLGSIQQSARALAEETGTAGLMWNGHHPNDLEDLPGIGKTYEGRLYDAGVCTWEKLAALSPEELASIVKAPKWSQPDYDAWIAYAQDQLKEA